MFLNRRMMEYHLDVSAFAEPLVEELANWLDAKCKFSHIKNAEWILWLPDSKDGVDEQYSAAPEPIKAAIYKCWNERANEIRNSMGYLHESPDVTREEQFEAMDYGFFLVVME